MCQSEVFFMAEIIFRKQDFLFLWYLRNKITVIRLDDCHPATSEIIDKPRQGQSHDTVRSFPATALIPAAL